MVELAKPGEVGHRRAALQEKIPPRFLKAGLMTNHPLSFSSSSSSSIPAQAQTVIVSVSFQYGIGLSARAPEFWKAVTAQDWPETIKILRSFKDAYPTRRRKEAALMEKIK